MTIGRNQLVNKRQRRALFRHEESGQFRWVRVGSRHWRLKTEHPSWVEVEGANPLSSGNENPTPPVRTPAKPEPSVTKKDNSQPEPVPEPKVRSPQVTKPKPKPKARSPQKKAGSK